MGKADTQPYRFQGLKQYMLLWFPTLAILYFLVWSFWGYGQPEWVFGVLAMLNFGYVVIFGLLKKYDGQLVVFKQDHKTIFRLELDLDPEEIEKREAIFFKVVGEPKDDYFVLARADGDEK